MIHVKKAIAVGCVVLVVLVGAIFPTGYAQAVSIEELVTRVQELMRQLEALQKQLNASAGATTRITTFVSDLRYGMKNNASVRNLQQLLIDKGYLAKGLATGNYFTLTTAAVRTFQSANGLTASGVLDRQTRDVINGLLEKKKELEVDGKSPIVKVATSTPAVTMEPASVPAATTTQIRLGYFIDPRPLYDMTMIERATFDAINVQRQQNGLFALQWSDQIASVARAHSADQAADNTAITNPDVACLYPFIRHEGFRTGFKVGDRLEQAGMQYWVAGENIIILPLTKELLYRADHAAPACAQVSESEGMQGETQEAARARIEAMLAERNAHMVGQERLQWVNKEWKDVAAIANESATDWMNSPGHRRNILTPEFEESAMGGVVVNDYVILTQVFIKRP